MELNAENYKIIKNRITQCNDQSVRDFLLYEMIRDEVFNCDLCKINDDFSRNCIKLIFAIASNTAIDDLMQLILLHIKTTIINNCLYKIILDDTDHKSDHDIDDPGQIEEMVLYINEQIKCRINKYVNLFVSEIKSDNVKTLYKYQIKARLSTLDQLITKSDLMYKKFNIRVKNKS